MSEKRKPLFIGLTGGVAAGKSTALSLLGEAGIPTLSADEVVHEVYLDSAVIGMVADRLGPQVIEHGMVNREAVAEAVFNEPEARVWLEQLIWPRVGQKIIDFRKHWESAENPPKAVVVEVPLLFESGMDQAFDYTIAVVADKDERMKRAAERGDVEIEAREERQLPQKVKEQRATLVVENDGSIDHLRREILDAIEHCWEMEYIL